MRLATALKPGSNWTSQSQYLSGIRKTSRQSKTDYTVTTKVHRAKIIGNGFFKLFDGKLGRGDRS